MKFAIYQESRQGRRQYNQDRLAHAYTRDALMMIVADGMGGHLHGEIAAQITVELFAQHFRQKAQPTIKNPWQFLKDSTLRAHDAILNYAASHHMLETPRTTLVAALIQDGLVYWAHVGDSRFYLLRNRSILAQTRDHSKVQQMVDRGEITEEEAEVHPEKNRLYNCVGSQIVPEVELGGKIPLQQGDTLLLCSDGLWGPLPPFDLVHDITLSAIQAALPKTMNKAELAAGPSCDNLSAIGLNWLEDDNTDSGPDSVDTRTMPMDSVTSRVDELDVARLKREDRDISDDEIERAIEEIHLALKKYAPPT